MLKDVPRLARRIHVAPAGDHSMLPYIPMPALDRSWLAEHDSGDVMSRLRTLEAVCRAVWDLAQYLEPFRGASVHAAIRHLLAYPARYLDDGVAYVLRDVLGPDTPTARVLHMVNQAVVLEGMYVLRYHTQDSHVLDFCRDLRSDAAWTVHVVVDPSWISVTHARRELAGDPMQGTRGRFEVAWQCRMLFDGHMAELTSSGLQITGVSFADDADERTHLTVGRALANGHLIL